MVVELTDTSAELIRVTLGYSTLHDRIHMDGLTAGGSNIRLWVTHRLMRQLVQYFTKNGHGALNKDKAEIHGISAGIAGTHQPDDPVVWGADDPHVLVESVDVKHSPKATLLVFKGFPGNFKASFSMPAASVPLWLQGVETCFEIAKWPSVKTEPALFSAPQTSSVTIH